MTNRNLQGALTDLALEILDKERGGLSLHPNGTGYTWVGKRPIFREPIILRGITFVNDEPVLRSGGGELECQDMIAGVGSIFDTVDSDDPFGRYFLEQVQDVFHAHPHELCLHGLEIHAAITKKR